MGLVMAGCGGRAGAQLEPTPQRHHHASATPTSSLPTSTAAAPTATAGLTPSPTTARPTRAAPTARPVAHAAPGRVLSAWLRPGSASAGSTLTATVYTSGSVSGIDVYLGSGMPNGPSPETFVLARVAPGTWSATGSAPSVSGQYHYTVGLYVAGRRTIVDNDNWNVQVTGGSSGSASGPQPLPGNVPLAPPFSYGNPVAATFTAEGRSINGSEVISTTRTDVTPTFVAQWYETHLPRAGWAVDQSTIPAAGATSFTIVGTAGSQVVVVQYAASTVYIFYGTMG
jgi:hypothetical protein